MCNKLIIYFYNFSQFQDQKLTDKLLNRHGETLDDKSLTICSGTDYININYQHIVCPDAATAKASKIFYFLLQL